MWSRCQETVVGQVVCSEAGGRAGGWWGDGAGGHRFKMFIVLWWVLLHLLILGTDKRRLSFVLVGIVAFVFFDSHGFRSV
ncbi:hypothetical protein HanPI659440_Chr06g0238671 [Helianthus annuus]|nr:hypothetical protein HanPI659440_Chr06g0238671 [Helianthus annuus]